VPIALVRHFNRNISELAASLIVNRYSLSSDIVRTFQDKDLKKILEINYTAFGDSAASQIIRYSKKFKNVLYVYEKDGEIVGYVGFYVRLKWKKFKLIQAATGYLGAVDKHARGKGIFTQMYSESLSELKRNGVKVAYGFIDVNNESSLAIHKKLGFIIIDELPDMSGGKRSYKVELLFDTHK